MPNMPNMLKYGLIWPNMHFCAYLSAPNMVKWGVLEKVLQNAVQTCWCYRSWGQKLWPNLILHPFFTSRGENKKNWAYLLFRANRNFTRVLLHNAFTTLWFGCLFHLLDDKNKSRHQVKSDSNDLDVLLISPGPFWLMMSIGAFGHFFAYTLSIFLLNVCLKFLFLQLTDIGRLLQEMQKVFMHQDWLSSADTGRRYQKIQSLYF